MLEELLEGELFEGKEQEMLLETKLEEIEGELHDEHFITLLEEKQLEDKLDEEILSELE